MTGDFATICGYTEEELVNYFRDYLPHDRKELDETLQLIREWYNGYDFFGYEEAPGISYEEHRQKMCVYNPYDVLFYLQTKTFSAHWFSTATPTFLVEYAEMNGMPVEISELEGIKIRDTDLRSFDLQTLDLRALMF